MFIIFKKLSFFLKKKSKLKKKSNSFKIEIIKSINKYEIIKCEIERQMLTHYVTVEFPNY